VTAGSPGGEAEVVRAGEVGELDVWRAVEVLQRDFAAASVAELTGGRGAGYYLRQAGLEMAVADRMRVRAVISMHRAVRAGASVAELTQATGLSCEQVAARWRGWADGQRRLGEGCPGLGISAGEYDQVAAVLAESLSTVDQERGPVVHRDPAGPWCGRQIGSPGP
jgi:hypothetical protein